jgi:hypothetical protein
MNKPAADPNTPVIPILTYPLGASAGLGNGVPKLALFVLTLLVIVFSTVLCEAVVLVVEVTVLASLLSPDSDIDDGPDEEEPELGGITDVFVFVTIGNVSVTGGPLGFARETVKEVRPEGVRVGLDCVAAAVDGVAWLNSAVEEAPGNGDTVDVDEAPTGIFETLDGIRAVVDEVSSSEVFHGEEA